MVPIHLMRGLKPKHKLRAISDLVRHLGICEGFLCEILDELCADDTKLYKSWEEPKKSGGTRPIDAPREKLNFIQKRIHERILQRTPIHKSAMGGIQGKRLSDSLKLHVRKAMLGNFDLETFFPNITSKQVYKMFCAIGAAPDVSVVLTRLITLGGKLPQGTPTSPMAANLVAGYGGHSCLDGRIEGLCQDHKSKHGRWIDDITISGPGYLKKLKPTVEKIIEQSGFKPNHDKTSFASNKESQIVTKHVVNVKPNVTKDKKRQLRAMLHRCKTKGSEPSDKTRIRGMIAHFQSINPDLGAKFLRDFNSIQWPAEWLQAHQDINFHLCNFDSSPILPFVLGDMA
jgi:RNA-directed DNA polymerase